MIFLLYLSEINTDIELLKKELNILAKKHGRTSDIVIRKSQELDVLIHKEMKIRIQLAKDHQHN